MENNLTGLSFGEKLVGLNFNPSGDEKVLRVKQICAELANILNENASPSTDEWDDYCRRMMRDHAIMSILDAQMNVVKVLTLTTKF